MTAPVALAMKHNTRTAHMIACECDWRSEWVFDKPKAERAAWMHAHEVHGQPLTHRVDRFWIPAESHGGRAEYCARCVCGWFTSGQILDEVTGRAIEQHCENRPHIYADGSTS